MNAKEIIRKAGYKIAKGIGREWEFFVSDGKFAATCYELPNGDVKAYSGGEESEGYRTNSEKLIPVIFEKAFEEEREFIATGGESLREYQLQNSERK